MGASPPTPEQPTREQLLQRLAFQEALLAAVADSGIQLMAIENGRVVHVGNRRQAHDFGFTDAMIDARPPVAAIIHPEDRARVLDYHRRRLAGDLVPDTYELAATNCNGERRQFEVHVAVTVVRDGEPARIIAVSRDITEKKRAEAALGHAREALEAREQMFRSLVENLPDIVIRYDRNLRRTYVSPVCEHFTGKAPSVMVGQSPFEHWVSPNTGAVRTQYLAALRQVVDTCQPTALELISKRADGTRIVINMRYVPERDHDGQLTGVLAVGQDVTEQRAIEDRLRSHDAHLRHVAYHDDLTGLPNRLMLRERLTKAIECAARNGHQVAILYLDLDGFKPANDIHGHAVGDQLLCSLARRLSDAVCPCDVVARIGGDEFVAMLAELQDAQECAVTARRLLETIKEPIVMDGRHLTLSASMGVSLYPDDEQDPDTLLRCADRAMYAAKAAGRNQLVFYGEIADRRSAANAHLLHDLHEALESDQLTVHYQPIVDFATGRIVEAEALVRWLHPTRGLVMPSVFVPLAEDSGLIQAIGERVFKEAARIAREWNRRAAPQGTMLRISVNRSPRQFTRGEDAQGWVHHLARECIPGGMLGIEITEGLLLEDRPEVFQQLEHMRACGMTVSLDDFGTGYSSLSYLKKFDIDCMKIDRTFIRDLTSDDSDRAVVEAIIAIGKSLGIKVIAEGVETRAQAELLAAAGCDLAQGFLFARPMPAEQFLEFATGAAPFEFRTAALEFNAPVAAKPAPR